MCNCNKPQCEECSCNEYCKTIIPAQCVQNEKYLNFTKGNNNTDLQVLAVTINNALQSLSDYPCISYTRVIDPITKVASYTHTVDWACVAEYTCEICNTPCECAMPTGLKVSFTGIVTPTSDSMYRVHIDWDASALATSYRIEYKKSSSFVWSVLETDFIYTSLNTLIIDVGAELDFGYDFRVRANCDGCESSYISTTTETPICPAPLNVIWNNDTYSLTWNAANSLHPMSSFEIGYKPFDSATYTYVTVPIIEVSPGFYKANLVSITFTPDKMYNFSVTRKCGGVNSSIGQGCANTCAVGIQTDPTSSVLGLDAVVSWSPVSGAIGYSLSVYNTTDSTLVIPYIFIGDVTSYNLVALEYSKIYEVTITPMCSITKSACNGKKTLIRLGSEPSNNIYNVRVLECVQGQCTVVGSDIVRIPTGSAPIIGGYYKDTVPSIYIYLIESLTTGVATIEIDMLTYRSSCKMFCTPPPDNYYNSLIIECDANIPNQCINTSIDQVLYVPFPATLSIGTVYQDFAGIRYRVTSSRTPTPGVLINTSIVVDCSAIC